MSLKAIKKVLVAARMGDVVRILDARDALKELAALEKAAQELLAIWGYARHDIEAEKIIESIAKEVE